MLRMLALMIAVLAIATPALAQQTWIYPQANGSYRINGPSGTTIVNPPNAYGTGGNVENYPAQPPRPNLGPYDIGGAQNNYGSGGGFGSRPYSTGGR